MASDTDNLRHYRADALDGLGTRAVTLLRNVNRYSLLAPPGDKADSPKWVERLFVWFARPVTTKTTVRFFSVTEEAIHAAEMPGIDGKTSLDALSQRITAIQDSRSLSDRILYTAAPCHREGPSASFGEHAVSMRFPFLDAFRLALLATAYKIDKGSYPETLQDLIPDYLDKLPLDPYTGKDYLYSVEADEVLVCSVGEHEVDGGGAIERHEDIGWRLKG